METTFELAVPVLPAIDITESLRWWTDVAGFTEAFRHGEPPAYAGIMHGDVYIHFAKVDDAKVARIVGEQTMLRLRVKGVDALYAKFQAKNAVHPNGALKSPPWGGREFGATEPCGVCVTFAEV